MTENDKKLLQAKHRLEEAEMRDRQKERKAHKKIDPSGSDSWENISRIQINESNRVRGKLKEIFEKI